MITIKQLKSSPDDKLMGLEKNGLMVFPNCQSHFEIPMIQGVPYIGQNKEEYKEAIKRFEEYFNQDFSSKEGIEWLKNYVVVIDHDLNGYNPMNVEDQFILHILKVHKGFGIVAINSVELDEAPISTFQFILSDDNKDLEARVNKKEIKLSAFTKLSDLWNSNTGRLITLAKYLFSANSGIGQNKQLAFDKLEDFISKSTENANIFLRATQQDPEYVETVVDIKDAIYRGIVRKENDGQYKLHANGTSLGRTEDEVIHFLMKSENKDLLGYGLEDDQPYSIKSQLKKATF